MQRVCPRCGKPHDVFIEGICSNCYLEKTPLVFFNKDLFFEQCKFCGKVKYLTRWIEFNPEMLDEYVKSHVKSKMVKQFEFTFDLNEEEKRWVGTGHTTGTLDGAVLEQDVPFEIKKRGGVCDACMKLRSEYFEATVQIRFEGKKDHDRIKTVVREAQQFLAAREKDDALAVLMGVKPDKKGVDLIIGSKKAGRDLANYLGKNSKDPIMNSSSLIGVLNGKAKKRFTFCVRL